MMLMYEEARKFCTIFTHAIFFLCIYELECSVDCLEQMLTIVNSMKAYQFSHYTHRHQSQFPSVLAKHLQGIVNLELCAFSCTLSYQALTCMFHGNHDFKLGKCLLKQIACMVNALWDSVETSLFKKKQSQDSH